MMCYLKIRDEPCNIPRKHFVISKYVNINSIQEDEMTHLTCIFLLLVYTEQKLWYIVYTCKV